MTTENVVSSTLHPSLAIDQEFPQIHYQGPWLGTTIGTKMENTCSLSVSLTLDFIDLAPD